MKAGNAVAGARNIATTAQEDVASGWPTVGASAFGLTVGPSCLTILAFGAFIAPLEREFHWGIAHLATGASIISIMMMILSPIQGVLVDRFGGRRLILSSIPVFALSLCAMYFLPNSLTTFYLAWVVIPICAVGVWPVSYLRTTSGWFDKNLGLALGCANAGIGVGTMLVPLITASLISAYGWREAYLGLGVMAFAAWPVTFLFLRDPRPGRTGISFAGDTFAEAARTRAFWLILAVFFLLGLFTTGLIIHQVKIFIDAGIPPATATAIPAAFGAALIVGRLGTGWFLDRISARLIMIVLMACGTAAGLLLATGPGVPLAILCALLVGLITGAEFDILSYIVPRYFGRRAFGKIYGLAFAVFQLSSAIGVAAIGASRVSFGTYQPALLFAASVCVMSAALFWFTGPYRFRNGVRI
jgi:predicted MFS family arabinose efflux permease